MTISYKTMFPQLVHRVTPLLLSTSDDPHAGHATLSALYDLMRTNNPISPIIKYPKNAEIVTLHRASPVASNEG